MKFLIALFVGSFLPHLAAVANVDILLGIVAGASLAMLCALVFIGPTPRPAFALATQPARRPARRQLRRNVQYQHGIQIFDYPIQGAMA